MTRPRRRTGKVFVISGPSGGGKTTVTSALLQQARGVSRSISATTRPPRAGERNGSHYRFVSERQFRRLRASGQLLESAAVHGASYGTPRAPVERLLRRGRDVVLSIDVRGARQIRRRFGRRAVLIFLLPPSLAVLRQRLMRRRTDAPVVIRRRLAAARRELACARWYDYAVVNDRLRRAVAQARAIVEVERLRVT